MYDSVDEGGESEAVQVSCTAHRVENSRYPTGLTAGDSNFTIGNVGHSKGPLCELETVT